MYVKVITTEYLGGLLSAYALTGGEDKVYLEKALKVVEAIKPAYNTTSGMPYLLFNPVTGYTYHETPDLSTVSGDLLERTYLSDLTESWQVQTPAQRASNRIKQLSLRSEEDKHFHDAIDVNTGNWSARRVSLNRKTADFYRAFLGSFIQYREPLGSENINFMMYGRAIEGLISAGVIQGNDTTGLGEVYELDTATKSIVSKSQMEYETCYVGGLLALGARGLKKKARKIEESISLRRETLYTRPVAARHRKLATQIAETCYQASTRTATKLGPASFSPGNFETWSAGTYNLK